MRQHRTTHHITHGPHIGQVGLAVAVHHDGTALVQLQAHGFGVEAVGVRHAADGHDQLVGIQLLVFALGVLVGDAHALLAGGDVAHLHAQLDLQTLLVESLLGFLGDLLVDCTQERGQAFQDRHVSPQATPHGTHFQADHAGTDHCQLLGSSADAQCAIVGEDVFLVERSLRQRTGIGAGRHDDVLAGDGFFLVAGNLHFVAAFNCLHEGTTAVEEGDLVLLEQVQDTVVVLLDHLVLAGNHLGHVHGQALDGNAVVSEVMRGMLVVLGALQQRLGRNATHVGAGAAGGCAALGVFPFIDTGNLLAQLRSANGCNVTAGAGTDDDDVELLGHDEIL